MRARRVLVLVGVLSAGGLSLVGEQAPAPGASPFPGQHSLTPPDWKYPVWPGGCGRFETDVQEKLACLKWNAEDFGRLQRFAAANAALEPTKVSETRVVFFGDSITDHWSKAEYGGFFPGRPYVNRGIGGQTTAQMLVRYRQDVIALSPKVVVILAGTNDIAGNAGPTTLAVIQDNLTTLAELARLHGIKVVLASLLPVNDVKLDATGQPRIWTKGRPAATIQALNTWIATYARQQGHVYLDYFSAMVDASGALKPELTGDGLHPNSAGYALMAPLAEAAIAQALK